jgi:hypothetical protein
MRGVLSAENLSVSLANLAPAPAGEEATAGFFQKGSVFGGHAQGGGFQL